MAYRIEIGLKRGVPDARGNSVAHRARDFLGLKVSSCRTRDVYKVDVSLSGGEKRKIRAAFTDPVVARSAIDRLNPPVFDWLVEVGFKAGVTDNVGRTAAELVQDVIDRDLSNRESVYTAIQYFIRGHLSRPDINLIAHQLLANNLIHDIRIYAPEEWAQADVDRTPPLMLADTEIDVQTYDLSGSDEELMRISSEGILSLSLPEMHAIRDYYALPEVRAHRAGCGLPPQPTDLELECLAQTWSEHCSHKIFSARVKYSDQHGNVEYIDSLFKTYIRGSTKQIGEQTDWLVSVFTDNAGVIRFNKNLYLTYKVETHNSPSALDPYGGAITGIVGCNRDPMGTGLGSELLCNTWGYCLGSPFYDGEVPEGLFHPRIIRDGVHEGVIDGGNQSGIPYTRGFEIFDARYIGKPLVYCGTLGCLPARVGNRPSEKKEVKTGDRVVMIGGRIGKDGIHGATFSSEELRQESPAQAVQIGDPITQRKMYEFIIEARDLGLYRAITDNGAGGLSSSAGEMAELSGGLDIDLARAPLKYDGLQPWEIFLSEAQERMTLAVPPEQLNDFMKLAARRDVEATNLGTFTDDGILLVRYGDRVVGRLDMTFLHEGCPRMEIEARWNPPQIPEPRPQRAGRRNQYLEKILGRLNVCSREFKSRMYDHEVKGRSIVKPFIGKKYSIPSDATVMLADYDSLEGIVLAEGINPFYSDLDTYHMTASVIDTAIRRIVATGGRTDLIAGLDNFCWPDPVQSEKTPDGYYKMAQLVRSNKALYDITTAYGVPCVSGKDSMKNDSVRGGRKISIPPTLLFSAVGKIDDVRKAVTAPFKQSGSGIYILGVTRNELGASEFHRMLAEKDGTPGYYGGVVPHVYPEEQKTLYKALEDAIRRGLVLSAHTPTLGGLAVGFALKAIGGELGAQLDLTRVPHEGVLTDDTLLFSESNGRFIITCTESDRCEIESIFSGLPFAKIGEVTDEPVMRVTSQGGKTIINIHTERLRKKFTQTLEGI